MEKINWKRLALTMALAATLSCMAASAQSLLPDTHQNDSVMWKLEYRFGRSRVPGASYRPWLFMKRPDSLSSVVVMRPNRTMMMNPHANKFKTSTKYYPQSVFSRRDDLMFYKDYGWANFIGDILFGK